MSSQTQPPLFRAAIASSPFLPSRYLAHSSLTRSNSKSLRMLLIKQGTSFWDLRDQCWRGLQQMFRCARCSWMSAPSGCSNRPPSERVEQWVFWNLCLCSRSGRYAYHQTDDGVVARRKSQWSKYSPNPRPGSRLTGGTSYCNNQRWGNVSIVWER